MKHPLLNKLNTHEHDYSQAVDIASLSYDHGCSI